MGIFFAVLSALSQAVLWVSLKKSYEKLTPSVAFFFDMLFGLFIWLPFALILGVDLSNVPLLFLFAFISGILSEAFVFFVMSKGEVSYTNTIFSTYPIFTIFFSLLINKESLSSAQWILVFLVILGTFIVSVPERITRKELLKKSFIIWPLLGAFAVGFSDTLSKSIIDKTSAQSFLFALSFVQIPIALAYLKIEKQPLGQFRNILKQFSKYKFALLGSLLNVLTVLFLWLSFQYAPASVASPITASYPGLTIILAIVFLKENVKPKDFLGFVIIILSIAGLGYFS